MTTSAPAKKAGPKAIALAPPAAPAPPAAASATEAIYRNLFDSFDPDSGGRVSPLEVLARLQRCGRTTRASPRR
jgi:hypothetical protein